MRNVIFAFLVLFTAVLHNATTVAAQPMDNDLYVGYDVTGFNQIDVYNGLFGFYKMPFIFTYSPSAVGGVALGHDNYLYVGFEMGNVHVYDPNGFHINAFVVNGPVSGMTIGIDGLLYVAYSDWPFIDIFDGTSGEYLGPSNFFLWRSAGGLAMDNFGNFYVGYNTFPYSVEIYDPDGFPMYTQIFDVGSPITGLAINSWDELLVGTSGSNQLKKYAQFSDWLIETFPLTDSPGGLALFRDSDWDGLGDLGELTYGTDMYNPDTDFDSKTDGDEVFIFGTDPLDPNS